MMLKAEINHIWELVSTQQACNKEPFLIYSIVGATECITKRAEGPVESLRLEHFQSSLSVVFMMPNVCDGEP